MRKLINVVLGGAFCWALVNCNPSLPTGGNGGTNEHEPTKKISTIFSIAFSSDQIHGVAVAPFTESFLRTEDGGNSWKLETIPNRNMVCLAFSNVNTVLAGGAGTFWMRSTDYGATWPEGDKFRNSLFETINGISFFGPGGIAVAGSGEGSQASGITGYSRDGGKSWNVPNIDVTEAQLAVSMVTVNTAFSCGTRARVFVTNDGGISWTYVGGPFTPPNPAQLNAIHFFDRDVGIVAGERGNVHITYDAGLNWTNKSISSIDDGLFHLFFANRNNGFIVGKNGVFLKSVDGGESWSLRGRIPGMDEVLSSYFFDRLTGFVVGNNKVNGDGVMKRTNDGGSTWKTVDLPSLPKAGGRS